MSQPAQILYIEDNPDNQRLVQRVLSARGYQVVIAEDGPNGLALARTSHPTLVLVDLGIPGLDGYETTTRLRSLPHLRGVPIIALTADASPGSRERALVAGCDGYLSKPIDARALPAQIAEFIEGRRERLPETMETALLRSYNQKLVERLEARVRELTIANAQLQDLDRLKDQFLATLSHELRTPLTSLLGYLELFDRGMLGPLNPQQEEAVRVMRRSGEILARQLNNLLYFQEIRSRALNFVALQPLDVLRPLIAMFRERAAQAQLQFDVALSDIQPIEVDRSAFEHLVRNLLDNAFQYNKPGGKVCFIVRDEPTRLIMRVEDTGIGIAPTEHEKIFLPFYQVDHSLARGHPGSGLGLAIVRHIVEAHGGQIALRSAPGEGSAFTVAIPRRSVGV
ncbi:hybrid sensor histidine kinase/response regulator [uncultured Chloroflexus sp.]|uniref:hybrid sensor histidine kinase/response regulator n=1 Tax=uncultured Chloroflexus sp. TaxID=214040 RepID=UPI002604ABAF|nr:hybrid sensor histidine kinase/response regulator [uncultured Chloroflexus sp.]